MLAETLEFARRDTVIVILPQAFALTSPVFSLIDATLGLLDFHLNALDG